MATTTLSFGRKTNTPDPTDTQRFIFSDDPQELLEVAGSTNKSDALFLSIDSARAPHGGSIRATVEVLEKLHHILVDSGLATDSFGNVVIKDHVQSVQTFPHDAINENTINQWMSVLGENVFYQTGQAKTPFWASPFWENVSWERMLRQAGQETKDVLMETESVQLSQPEPIDELSNLPAYNQPADIPEDLGDSRFALIVSDHSLASHYMSYNKDDVPDPLTEGHTLRWLDPEVAGAQFPGQLIYRTGYVHSPNKQIAHHQAYEARIKELRGYAEDDEDIEEVNEFSIRDFWSFMEMTRFARRAGLVLLDNGDLRAVWRENGGHNVGLEFQGDRSVLYVIFRRYSDGRRTERSAGIATFDDVIRQLRELDLISFVNG